MIKEYSKVAASCFALLFALSLAAHAKGAHIPAMPTTAKRIAQSSNNLGIQLYLILSNVDSNNIVFSPIATTMALGTTKQEAQVRGKTFKELNEVLQLNSRTIFNDLKQLSREIIGERNDGVSMEVESILVKDEISAKYKKRLRMENSGEFQHLSKSSGKTKKENPVLMEDFGIRGAAMVNAVSIKAHWEIPFTIFKRSSFFIPGHEGMLDRTVQVDFMGLMSDENQLNYLDDGDHRCQVIELNYGKDPLGDPWDPRYNPADVSMVIVLPYEDQPLSRLEEDLSTDTIQRWISRLKLTNIDVTIPKFNISCFLDVGVPLQELGARSLFSQPISDLSDNPKRGELPKLRSLWQEASIAASETGTEKAREPAEDLSIVLISNPKKTFHAVRPFLFFVRDKLTNTILFIGRVFNPNQQL